MTRGIAVLLAVAMTTTVPAQQSRPPDEVTRVVFATDARGEPVTDLRMNELSATAGAAAPNVIGFRPVTGGHLRSDVRPATPEADFVAILIDETHVLPADTPLLRQALRVIRDTVLTPDDFVAIVSTGRSSQQTDFARHGDQTRLTMAIERVMGAASSPVPDADTLVSLRTAASLTESTARTPDRMKALLLVTSGYPVNPFERRPATAQLSSTAAIPSSGVPFRDVIAGLAHVAAVAADAGTIIYAIDPHGVRRGPPLGWTSTPEAWRQSFEAAHTSMRALSGATGGFCICDTTDVRTALRSIQADLSNHYVLTLRTPDMSRLDSNNLRLTTTRPGVTLRYALQR